jgi:tetratricopeptide (TPR) repeat protein
MNYFDRSDAAITQATEWARKALEQVPNLPEAYRTLGRIMQTTGRVREAGTYFLKAATYKEDYYLAYRSLGWLSKDCFKYDDALKWIRKTLSINSTDLETIFLKGLVHFERKESKQAINDFTRCLELRPDYGRAHSFRGMTYFQLGRVGDAIASLQQAIDFGGDINAPYLLGYYYLCDHAYLKGINTLLEATARPEISFLAWFYLGLARLLIGQQEHMEDCFVAARDQSALLIKEVPDLSVAIAVHASCLALLGDTDRCRTEMTALVPFIEYDGSAAHDLARIYALLGDREQCARSLEIALDTCQGPTQVEIDLDPILNHFLEKCP